MLNEQIIFKNPNIPVFSRECSGSLNEYHFHSEIELISIISGGMTVKTETETYEGKAGDIIFISSNVPHSTTYTDLCFSGKLVQFRMPSLTQDNLGYLYKFFNNSGTPGFLFTKTEDALTLSECIEKIFSERNNKGASTEYYITSNMYMIISVLYRNNLFEDTEKLIKNKNGIERLLPVLEYIDTHYAESISLNDLSAILNLNKYYFCRIFKKIMGSTATDYINFVRTNYARKLLFTKKSIIEISCETGFSSLSYFNRTFKKYFQYPPSVYKKIAGRADNLI